MIANIDTFYFGVLCKGDQRKEKQGGRWRGSGVTGEIYFFNVAYIMTCAHGDGV